MFEWPSFLKRNDSEDPKAPENKPVEENKEDENEEEERIKIAENFISENYDKIKDFAEKIYERIGVKIDIDSSDWKNIAKESIIKALENGDWSETLAEEGTIREKVTALCVMMMPYIEESIQDAKETVAEENDSLVERIKELSEIFHIANDDGEIQEKIKKALTVIIADQQKDFEYMNTAGELLEKLENKYKEGDKSSSKVIVIEAFARLLQNEYFQKIASDKFRSWLNDNEEKGIDEEESIKEAVEEAV